MEHTQLQTLGDPNLYDFLVNAPKNFRDTERIKKFQLRNGDYIHCVLWNYHFYITGTDIVKILIWRFQNASKQIGAIKKFEEGIFSDLRNLKPGVDATLEHPRSEFLEFLYKNGCIRTQKKQKVFFWYSVPHDALFFDALERNMRRDSSIYSQGVYGTPREAGGGTRQACTRQKAGIPQNTVLSSRVPAHRVPSGFFEHKKPEPIQKVDPYNIRETLFGFSSGTGTAVRTPQIIPEASWLLQNKEPEKTSSTPTRLSSAVVGGFDDFDFGQFGFLKDRYKEQFGEEPEACRKKLFEGEKGEIAPRESFGEVHFIESKSNRQSE